MALQDIITKKLKTPTVGINMQPAETKEPENPFPNMSPEELEVYKSLDANKPVLEQLYRKTVQKPKEISEKGMKAAQTASHIGNSLGILAEMFGASQGARISPRQSNLVENQIATERAIRAQNEAENNQYNAGLVHAQYADAQQEAQNKAQKRAFMANLIRQKKADKLATLKILAQAERDKKDDEYKAKLLKLRERDINLKQSKRNKSSDENEGKFTGIVINARPDDKNAQQDAAGNRVIKYDMTPQEIQNVANKAKRDPNFLQRHPELYVTTRNEYTGAVTKGLTKDDEIAWTYLQEQYDNRAPAPEQPVIKTKIPQLVPTKKIPGF